MAVPQPARGADKPAEEAPKPKARVLDAPAPAAATDGCSEAPVKPKPIQLVQPAYTPEALEAQIEGKVRVEITISATGVVTDVRVLEGLGHGLDEAAIAAARTFTFTPATRCGEPIEMTLKVGVSFKR
jgi:protein TonB